MSKTTENYNLTLPELTDPADITQLNQNWDTIDKALIPNKVYSAIGTHNQYTGSKYVVTVPGLTELYKGLKLTIIPDSTSLLQYIYLNVNDTGNKYLIQTISSNTGGGVYGSCNDWVREGYPITVMFDGNMWRVLSVTVPSAEHLSGIVPIKHGGTGAEDAPSALANLGAAPSGYGLGGIAYNLTEVTDANAALDNGWYLLASDAANGIDCRAVMRVDAYSHSALIQTAYSTQYSTKYPVLRQRTCFNGSWGEWEWVNPPMEFGVPYRTTERWDGKAVYTMLVNLGVTAATATFTVPVESITNLIRYTPNLNNQACDEWDVYGSNDAGGSANVKNAFYFLAQRNSASEIDVYTVCGELRTNKTLYAQFWYTID